MLVGILEAETLPAKVTQTFDSYGGMFEKLLSPLDAGLRFRRYAVDQQQLPGSVDDCNAYIITGSRFSAYDSETWIGDLSDFIRELDRHQKKTLGICFGHQIVAHALGGKVERCKAGWGLGVASFDLHMPAQSASNNDFNILVTHQDQVVRLPPNARAIASNEFCPIGGYIKGDHIFCLQGHPEFNKEYLRYLIEKRKPYIEETTVAKALKSLDLPVDAKKLGLWLLASLQNRWPGAGQR